MSDSKLGGLPGLSEDQTVTLQPAPVVTFDNVTEAFNKLAQSAGDLANTGFGELSKQEGEQAVTRDASGNLQYKAPGFLSQVTGTQAAYEQAAKARYLSESALDVQPKVAGLKEKYAGDPDGFRQALDAQTGSILTATPQEFQAPVRAMIDQEGASALASITAAKQHDDLKTSADSQLQLWTAQTNQAYALARSGDTSSQQFNALIAKNQALETSLKNNPATAQFITPEIQAKFDALVPNLKGEAIVSHAAGLYDSTKDEGQAEQYLQDHLNDPSLGISDEEAHTYLSRGLAEIRTRHALSQQDTQQAQYEVEYRTDDAYKLALTQGPEARQAFMSDQEIRAAYTGKQAPHGEQIIERLNQAGMIFQSTNALRLMGPQQAQAYLAKLDPRNAKAPTVSTTPKMSIGQALYGQESSFGKNTTPNAISHGPMQITSDTWATAQKMGIVRPGEKIDNTDDNYNVGQRLIAHYDQQYNHDPARVSVAYFSGPGNVAPAGSATPYIRDTHDANNKYVSSYVSDVLKRMGGGRQSAGLDYAARANNFVAAQAAYQNIQQQLHSDPASYVIQNVPGISAQLSSKDPATFQSGLRAMITNQKAMGVAVPSVLTNSQKQMILGSFSTPPEGMSKAQNTLNMLNQLQHTYGQYYPQAMGELSKGGKLPADVTGLDWVKGGDPVVANRMSDAVNTGRESLSKLMPDNGNALKRNVLTGLAPFNSTLKGPGGSDVASQMAQSVHLYAMKLVAEGVDPGKAATQAVQDIVGGNFHMADTYRVPANIDPGAVGHGVSVILRGLAPSNVEPFVGAKGVTFQDRQKASASILKDQGVWLTLPDNSGLYLAWPAQTGYARARTPAGQPIQYTWAQLQAASKAPLSYEELSATADKAQAQVPSHVPGLAGQQ